VDLWTRLAQIEWVKFISLVMSAISLAISAAVANFTVFRQVDELKLVINNNPGIAPERKGLDFFGPLLLTFINSGNRTIEITDVTLFVIQPPVLLPEARECGYNKGPLAVRAGFALGDYYQPIDHTAPPEQPNDSDLATYAYAFSEKPFPVNVGEIVYKRFEISSLKQKLIPLTHANGSQKGAASVCLQIKMTSVDSDLVSRIALSTNSWTYADARRLGGPAGTISYFNSDGPITILENRNSWFSETTAELLSWWKQFLLRQN